MEEQGTTEVIMFLVMLEAEAAKGKLQGGLDVAQTITHQTPYHCL